MCVSFIYYHELAVILFWDQPIWGFFHFQRRPSKMNGMQTMKSCSFQLNLCSVSAFLKEKIFCPESSICGHSGWASVGISRSRGLWMKWIKPLGELIWEFGVECRLYTGWHSALSLLSTRHQGGKLSWLKLKSRQARSPWCFCWLMFCSEWGCILPEWAGLQLGDYSGLTVAP